MKIRLGLAAIIGMLCLMVGVIAGGRAALTNTDGELAAGELTTAGTDEHDHADDGHTHGEGDDHAEGMGLLPDPGERLALIVYDSPAAARLTPDGAVIADIVELP